MGTTYLNSLNIWTLNTSLNHTVLFQVFSDQQDGCTSVNHVQGLTGPVVSISQLITVNSFSFDKLHAPFNSCKPKNIYLNHGTGWTSFAQSLKVAVWLRCYV